MPDDVTPSVLPAAAWDEARLVVGKYLPAQVPDATYSEPRLEILNRGVLEAAAATPSPSRLAWFIEASGSALREYIWIDAQTGDLLLHFSQLTDAKNRTIYNLAHGTTLPGTLVRSEGDAATGDTDTDVAYDYSGATYDYYWTNHGRDSFDNAGATLISSVHYGTNYQNAGWNGSQMVYGDGFASADDVVAHELTHAVTERSANLLYYMQSGALNESFSDIFGETVDLTDGLGNDAPEVRWLMGEDLPDRCHPQHDDSDGLRRPGQDERLAVLLQAGRQRRRAHEQWSAQPRVRADGRWRHLQRRHRHRHRADQSGQDPVPCVDHVSHVGFQLQGRE